MLPETRSKINATTNSITNPSLDFTTHPLCLEVLVFVEATARSERRRSYIAWDWSLDQLLRPPFLDSIASPAFFRLGSVPRRWALRLRGCAAIPGGGKLL